MCKRKLQAKESQTVKIYNCPNCNEIVRVPAVRIEPVTAREETLKEHVELPNHSVHKSTENETKMLPFNNIDFIIAALAALIMILGVFLPVVKAPIIGSINYFQNGQGDGTYIIILSLISALIGFEGKRLWNLFPGILITIILIYFFYNVRHSVAAMKQTAGDGLFGGLAATMADTIQIQFGWFLMLLGNIALYVSIFIKTNMSYTGKMPWWNKISIAILVVIGAIVLVNQGDRVGEIFAQKDSMIPMTANQDFVSPATLEEVPGQEQSVPSKSTQQVKMDLEKTVQMQTNVSFFGIKLGESLAEVNKRFQVIKSHYEFTDKDIPATLWNVLNSNPIIKEIVIAAYQNRVYQIQVYFTEVSEGNYAALKNEISNKYGNEIDLGFDGIVMGGQRAAFTPSIDGIETMIVIEYSGEVMDNQLFVKYIHTPLNDKVHSDKLSQKASKFSDDL
jgi:hypothetical protein